MGEGKSAFNALAGKSWGRILLRRQRTMLECNSKDNCVNLISLIWLRLGIIGEANN